MCCIVLRLRERHCEDDIGRDEIDLVVSRHVPTFVFMVTKQYNTTNMVIDLHGWMTQADYARLKDYKLNTISRWVKRAKEGEGKPKIQYLDVPALGITLVKPL